MSKFIKVLLLAIVTFIGLLLSGCDSEGFPLETKGRYEECRAYRNNFFTDNFTYVCDEMEMTSEEYDEAMREYYTQEEVDAMFEELDDELNDAFNEELPQMYYDKDEIDEGFEDVVLEFQRLEEELLIQEAMIKLIIWETDSTYTYEDYRNFAIDGGLLTITLEKEQDGFSMKLVVEEGIITEVTACYETCDSMIDENYSYDLLTNSDLEELQVEFDYLFEQYIDYIKYGG